jgi:hypothetical protein
MKSTTLFTICALAAAQDYKYGPDSERHDGVPRGTVTEHTWTTSLAFPGTERKYWVYVPAQYSAAKPAALMVFQDGAGQITDTGATRVPVVFDNLIHKGEMPVTIGVFIDPGTLPPTSPDKQARVNRSYEYDAVIVNFRDGADWYKANWVFRQLCKDAVAQVPELDELKQTLEMAQAYGGLDLNSNDAPAISAFHALKTTAAETLSGSIKGRLGTHPRDINGQQLYLGAVRELMDLMQQQP